jgi:hypothetical protein
MKMDALNFGLLQQVLRISETPCLSFGEWHIRELFIKQS